MNNSTEISMLLWVKLGDFKIGTPLFELIEELLFWIVNSKESKEYSRS